MSERELTDYYGLLGIPCNSTVSEIHKAYWRKASRNHPDRGGTHEQMVQLVEAWKILSDPARRARYDQLLSCRHDGWQSKKLNDDVRDARIRAKIDAARSWAEFEEVYQKAFYIFNQDFYGDERLGKVSGAYSPLMEKRRQGARDAVTVSHIASRAAVASSAGSLSNNLMKTAILVVSILAALTFFRSNSSVVRYVPLEQQDAGRVLMLDTSTGAIFSIEKRSDNSTGPWKEIVPPLPKEKKSLMKNLNQPSF